jgi:predicted RNase H-like nuclease (RuvC/YqgF family)
MTSKISNKKKVTFEDIVYNVKLMKLEIRNQEREIKKQNKEIEKLEAELAALRNITKDHYDFTYENTDE